MNLQHHILIAMPSLDDPYFARSVVYLCEHNENGAMGLVINKPIEQLSVGKILQKLKISPTSVKKASRWKNRFWSVVLFPKSTASSCTPVIKYAASTRLTDDLFLTTSKTCWKPWEPQSSRSTI